MYKRIVLASVLALLMVGQTEAHDFDRRTTVVQPRIVSNRTTTINQYSNYGGGYAAPYGYGQYNALDPLIIGAASGVTQGLVGALINPPRTSPPQQVIVIQQEPRRTTYIGSHGQVCIEERGQLYCR